MSGPGWLPEPVEDLFGAGARAADAYDTLTVDVPAGEWIASLRTARDRLGCTFFDWLSAVDESGGPAGPDPDGRLLVCAHVVALGRPGEAPRRLLLRTALAPAAPALPTATGLWAGAAWHERETREMFGVEFTDHPAPGPLLLPEGFEGHPLRKGFVLAARVVKAWPGAKEPGEPGHGGPKRRQMLPPGVPDPNEWGPLKGTLPAAPTRGRAAGRPAAGRRAEGATPTGDAPAPRRSRSAGGGSASQRAADAGDATTPPVRRSRSAGEGSASQRAAGGAAGPDSSATPSDPAADRGAERPRRTARPAHGDAARSADAPWHDPRPARE
ncbi:NADH-quinone oxidoreductase subunit C, partial [Streptomyces calidiresistens]